MLGVLVPPLPPLPTPALPHERPPLSKSTFLVGARCHRALWWHDREPDAHELRPSPGARHRMEEGARVGRFARGHFPGGVLVERAGRDLDDILRETHARLHDASVPALFEAGVAARGVLVHPDVIVRT